MKYLRTEISRLGKTDMEVNDRIAAAIKQYHSIRNGLINKKEINVHKNQNDSVQNNISTDTYVWQ